MVLDRDDVCRLVVCAERPLAVLLLVGGVFDRFPFFLSLSSATDTHLLLRYTRRLLHQTMVKKLSSDIEYAVALTCSRNLQVEHAMLWVLKRL